MPLGFELFALPLVLKSRLERGASLLLPAFLNGFAPVDWAGCCPGACCFLGVCDFPETFCCPGACFCLGPFWGLEACCGRWVCWGLGACCFLKGLLFASFPLTSILLSTCFLANGLFELSLFATCSSVCGFCFSNFFFLAGGVPFVAAGAPLASFEVFSACLSFSIFCLLAGISLDVASSFLIRSELSCSSFLTGAGAVALGVAAAAAAAAFLFSRFRLDFDRVSVGTFSAAGAAGCSLESALTICWVPSCAPLSSSSSELQICLILAQDFIYSPYSYPSPYKLLKIFRLRSSFLAFILYKRCSLFSTCSGRFCTAFLRLAHWLSSLFLANRIWKYEKIKILLPRHYYSSLTSSIVKPKSFGVVSTYLKRQGWSPTMSS